MATQGNKKDLGLAALGMGALLFGAGPLAIIPFGLGLRGMERKYRAKHDFEGTFAQRWARSVKFYEGTHQNSTNRVLHAIGMPFIVAGAAGLLVSSPLNPLSWPIYAASFASFAGGWAFNLAGHKFFEKNAPAFADDPLSFVAGPMWEIDLIRKKVAGKENKAAA